MYVTLYRQSGDTTAKVVASFQDGDLRISGEDFGAATQEWFGRDEYEYKLTVPASQRDALLRALLRDKSADPSAEVDEGFLEWPGQRKESNILLLLHRKYGGHYDVVSEFVQFLERNDVEFDFFSWP